MTAFSHLLFCDLDPVPGQIGGWLGMAQPTKVAQYKNPQKTFFGVKQRTKLLVKGKK